MATYFFGINDGQGEYTVTSAATTTSKDVEVVLNTTANVPSTQELLNAINNIQNYIIRTGKSW